VSITEALLESLRGDAPVRQAVVGAFWTAVALETDPPRCGLASTLRPDSHPGGPPVPRAGSLHELGGRELAGWLRSGSTLKASIGMAAFNALLVVDEAPCVEVNAEELIRDRGAGRRVAIVGHFPFVSRVRQIAAHCDVLELNPRAGELPAERATDVLPKAEVVALTGTALINHTFDALISLCAPEAYVVLLGGSAPLTPLLFDYGVDAVGGTWVVDSAAALRTVGQGATFPQIQGKRLLVMAREGVQEGNTGGQVATVARPTLQPYRGGA
jgi:uncharacterized protein (DUF4213/DUF364 family)